MLARRWTMIKEEFRNRSKAMLDKETAKSYICLIGTSDDRTGLDYTGSIMELTAMLSNAALLDHVFRIALKLAVAALEEYDSDKAKSEANC